MKESEKKEIRKWKKGVLLGLIAIECLMPFKGIAGQTNRAANKIRFIPPRPPSGDAPAGRLRGGASRGECPTVPIELTALVSTKGQISSQESPKEIDLINVWGLTTQEHPTILIYTPYTDKSAHSAEFILQDDRDNDIYRHKIALPKIPGVMNMTIPNKTKGLEIGKNYRWYFKVYCKENNKSRVYVEGTIQRINLSAETKAQLARVELEQQVEIYATNGIWYDAIALLAKMLLENPTDNLVSAWNTFLQDNALGEISRTNILNRSEF